MDVQAYLQRIGYAGPVAPALEVLSAVHRQHMLAVPFENLDIHLGRTIVLDEHALFRKIVGAGRGGFCYELNGLFAALLRAIGFDLDLLSARVAHADGSFGQEYDHLLIAVRIDGRQWLADVGFGESFLEPLLLHAGEQHQDGVLYFIDHPHDELLPLRYGEGEWSQKYLFTSQPRRLEEFAGMCVYHQTSPASSFTQGRVCTRATPDGRVTLAERKLVQTSDGVRTESVVNSEAEYLDVLRQHFGIVLQNPAWRSPLPATQLPVASTQ